MHDVTLPEVVLRVLLALVPAAIIGLEREYTLQPAGLRTHILLGVGACTFTLAGVQVAGADPTRVAAQVASGVGFLGAGAILHEQLHITGLTTAASLWVTASIGVASGLGAYSAAVVTTVTAVLVLAALKSLEGRLPLRGGPRLVVIADPGHTVDRAVRQIRDVLPAFELRAVQPGPDRGSHRLIGHSNLARDFDLADVTSRLQTMPGVSSVELRNG